MKILICLAIIVIDQISKFYAVNYVKSLPSVNVINNLLRFVYVENYGAAFGMLQNCKFLFIVVTIIIMIVCFYLYQKNKGKSKLLDVALICFIGGGIGNFIDRILYGYVVDFISLSFFAPVFNLADIFISIGAVLIVIYSFTSKDKTFLLR